MRDYVFSHVDLFLTGHFRLTESFRTDHHSLSEGELEVPPQGGVPPIHIAFVASECVPFQRLGAGDVVGALPKRTRELGHQVSVYVRAIARPSSATATVVRQHHRPF